METKENFLKYWHQKLHISIADKEAIYNECIKENVDPNKVVRYALENGFDIRNTPDYLVSFFKLGKEKWYERRTF
jgi:hypothetical protein